MIRIGQGFLNVATAGTRLTIRFRPPITEPTTKTNDGLFTIDKQDVVERLEETEEAFSLIVRREKDAARFRMNYFKVGVEAVSPHTEALPGGGAP